MFCWKGKSESLIFLPVNSPWREQFPPAVFGCCCLCSLCLTLSSKTKSVSIYLQALTHWEQLRHSAFLLIHGIPTESTFHCNINFLMSIRSNLTQQFMLKIFPIEIANWGRRTFYSFYPVKDTHPLCFNSSVTGDLCEMQNKANRGQILNVHR